MIQNIMTIGIVNVTNIFMDINNLRKIVIQRIENSGLSQNEISKRLGIQQASLNRFLKGQTGVSYEMGMKLLEFCGHSVQPKDDEQAKPVYFVQAKVLNKGKNPSPLTPDDYLAAPLYSESAASPGLVQHDEMQGWFMVYKNEPSVRMCSNLIAVKMGKASSAMTPTLSPGDITLVDRNDNTNPQQGRIYLVAEPGGQTKIRRVSLHMDKALKQTRITFYSDNSMSYPPEIYYLESDYKNNITRAILGRVIWAWVNTRER